jgi:hypothetical protein
MSAMIDRIKGSRSCFIPLGFPPNHHAVLFSSDMVLEWEPSGLLRPVADR